MSDLNDIGTAEGSKQAAPEQALESLREGDEKIGVFRRPSLLSTALYRGSANAVNQSFNDRL